tara:strand:+ start:4471 stop:5283 length:813 start_codon:yes stop_codon:yes gene_type:complete
MIISHEVPKCFLTESLKFNDYDYCLPHLLDENKDYRDYFKYAKEEGRYIIMDNSLHELGKAYNYDRLRYWVTELQPNEFIVPDVWMNCSQTAAQAKYWKQFKYPKNTKITAVIQGENKNQAYLCANLLINLGYEKLCVSYGATWYNDFFPHTNPDMGKALGRIRFVQGLLKLPQMNNIKFHLLGCSIPQEFSWYDDHPQIESIDTSNPIMAAIDGKEYSSFGLKVKPKANMNDHFDQSFRDSIEKKMIKNLEQFRKINGLRPYPEHTGSI